MAILNTHKRWNPIAPTAIIAWGVCMCLPIYAADVDFAAAVVATDPVAYYRLDSTAGKSLAGASTYKSMGGVSAAAGAPAGAAKATQFNGVNGYILTTQVGGVGIAASMMAWVNLAELPSNTGHIFYIAGESQYGNDLDMQIETDNVLRFYTASGGNLRYTPPPATLPNQWHMIVATLDTATHTRVIYWDGNQVATDKGGGEAGKTTALSIGASTVFGGRFFKGGIAEVGLWSRALNSAEVTTIFAASGAGGGPVAGGVNVGTRSSSAGSGGITTTAKVEVGDSSGPVPLQRPEVIALMFLGAMQTIEYSCQSDANRACTLEQMVSGATATNGRHIERLKFDPKTDPNYTYTVGASGVAWEAHATAKRPGLKGFYFFSRGFPSVTATYNRSGTAGVMDSELSERSIDGDTFATSW